MKKNNKKDINHTIHELNNLLTNINLSAEMLVKDVYGTLNAKQKKYVNIILSEAKKMASLIRKIN